MDALPKTFHLEETSFGGMLSLHLVQIVAIITAVAIITMHQNECSRDANIEMNVW